MTEKKANPLFQAFKYISPGISDGELRELLPMLTEGKVKQGGHLVNAGEKSPFINFITKGAARMYYAHENGNETNIILAVENQFIQDYESVIKNKPYDFSIQATEGTSFIHIDYNKFEPLLCSGKNWEHCGRMINQFVLFTVFNTAQAFLFLTPEQRYLKLFTDEPHLLQRFSLEQVANYIGVKRESLSRIRNRIIKRF